MVVPQPVADGRRRRKWSVDRTDVSVSLGRLHQTGKVDQGKAATHLAFEPRTSGLGRSPRSMRGATFSPASKAPSTRITCRSRGSMSSHNDARNPSICARWASPRLSPDGLIGSGCLRFGTAYCRPCRWVGRSALRTLIRSAAGLSKHAIGVRSRVRTGLHVIVAAPLANTARLSRRWNVMGYGRASLLRYPLALVTRFGPSQVARPRGWPLSIVFTGVPVI
jgi:hypothetical protein